MDGAPTYLPDRFYVLSDAGSVYCDAEAGADGFESPQAAAEWARRQTGWQYGSELDFSDGVTSTIALGAELNAANAAWDQWDAAEPYPAVSVHNHAIDLGLVAESGGAT